MLCNGSEFDPFDVKLIDFGLAVYLPPGMKERGRREGGGGEGGRERRERKGREGGRGGRGGRERKKGGRGRERRREREESTWGQRHAAQVITEGGDPLVNPQAIGFRSLIQHVKKICRT
jgi:hypothetical protein